MRSLLKFIQRRWRLFLAIGFAIVILPLCLLSAFLYVHRYELSPGGMSGTYPAVDFDRLLTQKARSALPIIQAIEAYHEQHHAYPVHVSALIGYMPAGTIRPGSHMIGVWTYAANAKLPGYVLSQRLGWDPDLEFHRTSAMTFWTFEPGDGGPSKRILLNP